jgi:hypothetical protein
MVWVASVTGRMRRRRWRRARVRRRRVGRVKMTARARRK